MPVTLSLVQVCRTWQSDGSTANLLRQTGLIPASIAVAIYLVVCYVVLPYIKQHRHRYDRYLPFDSLSARTASFRDRVPSWMTPPSWLHSPQHRAGGVLDMFDDDDSNLLGDDEGDRLTGFEIYPSRMRKSLRPNRPSADGARPRDDPVQEGFHDESDSDFEDDQTTGAPAAPPLSA